MDLCVHYGCQLVVLSYPDKQTNERANTAKVGDILARIKLSFATS